MHRTSLRALRAIAWIALASVSGIAATGAAAADYYLKLEGLKGESADRINNPVPRAGGGGSGGLIEIQSWSWGATQTSHSSGGGGLGSARVNKIDAFTVKQTVRSDDVGEARAAASTETTGGAPAAASGKVTVQDFAAPSLTSGKKVSMQDMQVTSNAAIPDPSSQGLAVSDPGAGGPKTASKRQHGPVTLSTPLDRGSITLRGLVTGCAGGTTYRSATLTSRAYKYEFQDVFITSCATAGGGGGGALPMESISFNYGKIVTKATSASDKMQWDLAQAKKL